MSDTVCIPPLHKSLTTLSPHISEAFDEMIAIATEGFREQDPRCVFLATIAIIAHDIFRPNLSQE